MSGNDLDKRQSIYLPVVCVFFGFGSTREEPSPGADVAVVEPLAILLDPPSEQVISATALAGAGTECVFAARVWNSGVGELENSDGFVLIGRGTTGVSSSSI